MKIKNIIKNKNSRGILVIIERNNNGVNYNERMEFESRKHFNSWLKFNEGRSKRRRERIKKSCSLK